MQHQEGEWQLLWLQEESIPVKMLSRETRLISTQEQIASPCSPTPPRVFLNTGPAVCPGTLSTVDAPPSGVPMSPFCHGPPSSFPIYSFSFLLSFYSALLSGSA